MNLNLITRATVKTQLGITTSDYDSKIDAMIPVVSADVRRITGNEFNRYCLAVFSSSADTIDFGLVSLMRELDPRAMEPMLNLGTVLTHDHLPADTYLESYNPVTNLFTLSATPTGTGDYVYPTVNISQWPAISKMIFYRITKQTTASASEVNYQSISYGPVSKSFAQSEINKKWNYPQILIDDLGPLYAEVG